MPMDSEMNSGTAMTTPQCRASDTPWLTSLAWCMHTQCAGYDVSASDLEKFWEEQITGDPTVVAKWTYAEALFNISQPPTNQISEIDKMLNSTALVNAEDYQAQFNAMKSVERESIVESAYGITILVAGFGSPVALTWLGSMPYMSKFLAKIKPYLLYPTILGTYHIRPLPYRLGNAPTIGQGLFIGTFSILVLVLTTVNYESRQPHAWFATQRQEITAYVFYRTGTLAFALAPLVFLFASRNNILLWMTNWSHSTFLLLHRWVARLFALQVLLHSLLALPLYYPQRAQTQYWIWGSLATVAVMVLVLGSGLYVRKLAYEVFLITHILLAVLVLVGCWYHINKWIGLTWGYETWLYAACAVWFFDRLARVGRVLKNGLRRAQATDLGEGYVRVDIQGIRWGAEPGKHAYVFFPTLSPLRPWENHPFSIVPTPLLQRSSHRCNQPLLTDGLEEASKKQCVSIREKELDAGSLERGRETNTTLDVRPGPGATLFIKKSTGVTRHLRAHAALLVALDGPYSNSSSTREVLRCDRILLIGGGIGITSLLPWVARHWNVKLCWGVKESARCLVDAIAEPLSAIAEKDVRVGRRLDLEELLAEEVNAGWHRVGVVVSGPGGLCDDARAAVAAAGRAGKTVFELEVDAYSW